MLFIPTIVHPCKKIAIGSYPHAVDFTILDYYS
jgi:hypothetical protein